MKSRSPLESRSSTAGVERLGITHARPEAGEVAHAAALMVETSDNGSAHHESLVGHFLNAAERLTVAYSLLCEDTGRHGQALTAMRDRVSRVVDQLQRLVTFARDTLAPSPAPRPAMHADPSSESRSRPAVIHTANDERAPCTIGDFLERADATRATPSLVAYLLGAFQVLAHDVPIEVWPNGKSKAVLKYLLLNRKAPAPREVLMDLFWPDVDPDSARNSLNVSIHRLRRALAHVTDDFPFVVFRDGCYSLNPKLKIWTDVDAFSNHLRRARQLESAGAMQEALDAYAAGVALYSAELLPEDRYDDWLVPLRQELRDGYLAAVHRLRQRHFAERDYSACMGICARILAVDACDEEAHRALMRCYARLCQPQLAQRQYQRCVQTLTREMGILPSRATTELYRQIVHRQDI
jgi:DNA-binding SARP family transcriptional activator